MHFYGIDKMSLVDYDNKIACTLFTCGCNFRCPFCHNKDLVLDTPEFAIAYDEIWEYLSKREGILDAVVISGGEPTLHKDLPDFIKKVKTFGYQIKLDTNGTNPEMVKYLVEKHLVDYIAMDIKNSKEEYAKTVGLQAMDFEKIEETIQFLIRSGVDFEFRTTLVNEFHNEKSIEEMAKWIKGAKRLRLQKFVDGEGCIKRGLHEVSKENALRFKDICKKYIDDVELRSY